MSDLTEQWKKGELPSGWYYVKNEFGNIFPSDYSEDYDCISDTVIKDFFTEVSEIKEVLEPVPSYDEWKEKNNALTALLAEYGKLTKELQDEKEKHMTRISLRSPLDEMVIEKQVWESTLHRSMVLQAENAQLKELLKECKPYIGFDTYEFDEKVSKILTKIDEVLK